MSNGQGKYQDQKRAVGEQLWLHYYNDVLFKEGMITEEERNRMANRINTRNISTNRKNYAGASC